MNPQPADETPLDETAFPLPAAEGLPEQRVEELAAYDEQLRRGEGQTWAAGEPLTTSLPPDLVECLHWIEEVWPRAGKQPAAERELPSHIGRFEIARVLGQGGFGIVYLARDPLLNRQVALKVPRLHALASDSLRERFRREARATAALDHPHIVPIHEMGEAGPLHYLAFAYCEGPNLAQWLKLQAGPVPPHMAAGVVRALAEAVHYSHDRGVLHRDLKPSNVLLFPVAAGAGEMALPYVPRIVDFGLARLAEEELEATGTTGVIGTPLYMAPEQALGLPEEVGPAADIYALGIILYELLCGRPPFVGTRPLEVLDQVRSAEPPPLRKQRPEVPRDLETICLKCLQKRPAERYATAQALADDLARFLQGAEVLARPVTMWLRLVRWCQQPQRLREAGWTVVAVNIVMGGWTLIAAIAVAAGWVPRPDHLTAAEVWRQLLPVVVLTSPVLAAVGVAIMNGKKWAAQIGAGTGAGMTVVALLLGLRWIENPYSWLYNDIPGYALQVYLMLAMLCLVQTLASAIAWMALRAKEQGMLPRMGTDGHG